MIRNPILALALTLALCTGSDANRAAPARGVVTADLNRTADPCSDFYEFANGAWRAENPIPPGRPRWSRRIAAQDAAVRQVQGILEEISRRKDWPGGSAEQIAGDFYASCMDETSVEAAGLAPLSGLLESLDSIRDRAGVERAIRSLQELDIAAPFGVTTAPDFHEPANTLVNIVAGGLGLPDRDDYRKDEARFAAARESYPRHIARLLRLGGMAERESAVSAAAIVVLEQHLAEASLDAASAGDPAATDHRMSFGELERLAPHFDWAALFEEAGLPRGDVNVAEPKFLQQMDRELDAVPAEVWRAYLKWRLLDTASPWLSRPFADEAFAFRSRHLGDDTGTKPRAERCAETASGLFGDAVGKLYVRRYFPPESKAKALEIAENLLAALKEDVEQVPWMEPATRRTALEKLARTNLQLGYPDRWNDDSRLVVRRDSLWANVAAGRRFHVGLTRALTGKPTDRSLWQLPASSPLAYIDPQLNVLVLPAGFLQPPYFNPEASDAVNYGALGIGLAHDLTHAVDASGSENDVQGRPRNWWTDADRAEFGKRTRCVVEQFDGYFIEPGVHHDGRRVLSESIGDLAGVRLAYRALETSMTKHPVPVIDGFTAEQQFFISWGQTTGAAMRIEAERELVAADPHPVPQFRVIGPFSNTPEFQKAFSCGSGSPMVRPPEKRCRVW